jgi:hypothetical protein
VVAYLGNLTCADCGLTFTAAWGGGRGTDEYRCERDHVVTVRRDGDGVVAVDGASVDGVTLSGLRGRCPRCSTELRTGRLPRCPVCGGRDHDVLLAGTLA